MSRVRVSDIQRATARSFGIPLSDLTGRSAFPEHSRPRQMAMLLARELTGHSYTRLGQLFDRDHSTVIHGIEQSKRRLSASRSLSNQASLIRSLFVSA